MNYINNWLRPITLGAADTSTELDLPDGTYRLTLSNAERTAFEYIDAVVSAGSAQLVRALEGTAAQTWLTGSVIYCSLTAEVLAGLQGEDGRGIVSLQINGSGRLIVNYTDGASIDLGAVVGEAGADGLTGPSGPQGEPGPQGEKGDPGDAGPAGPIGPQGEQGVGLNIVGSLSSPDDLPVTGAVGDAYLIAGNLWVWSVTAWVDAGQIQGPKGDAGPQGVKGDPGPAGSPGDAGAVGPQGPAGPAGEKGDQGAPGPAGPKGDTGARGAQGPAGETGPQGPAATALPTRSITGATDTITPADAGRMLICTSATPVTLTIDAEATASWEKADAVPVVHVFQAGAGAVTITGAGFSVTTHAGDTNVLDGNGAAVTAMRTASNVWRLFGRLVAA